MSLERINLNVPRETRLRLKAVAKRLKKTESEVARDLLADALRREEKAEFYRKVSAQMTPALRERLLEIADAFERLDAGREAATRSRPLKDRVTLTACRRMRPMTS